MEIGGATAETFVQTSIIHNCVWSLRSSSGWVLCDSAFLQESDVVPFWTNEEEASRHCTGEWRAFKPEKIMLDDFVNVWLKDLAEDEVLVGIEWDDVLSGIEVDADELAVVYQRFFSVSH